VLTGRQVFVLHVESALVLQVLLLCLLGNQLLSVVTLNLHLLQSLVLDILGVLRLSDRGNAGRP